MFKCLKEIFSTLDPSYFFFSTASNYFFFSEASNKQLPVSFLNKLGEDPNHGCKRVFEFLKKIQTEFCEFDRKSFSYLYQLVHGISERVFSDSSLEQWEELAEAVQGGTRGILAYLSDDLINIMARNLYIGIENTAEFVKRYGWQLDPLQLRNINQSVLNELLNEISKEDLTNLMEKRVFKYLPGEAINNFIEHSDMAKEEIAELIANDIFSFSSEHVANLKIDIIKNFSIENLRKLSTISMVNFILFDSAQVWSGFYEYDIPEVVRRDAITYLRDDLIEIIVNNPKKGETKEQRLDFVKEFWLRFSEKQRKHAIEHHIINSKANQNDQQTLNNNSSNQDNKQDNQIDYSKKNNQEKG